MRSIVPALLLFVMLVGCASGQSAVKADDERYRRGSRLHAYGGTFAVSGGMSLLAGAGLGLAYVSSDSDPKPKAVLTGSLVALGVGVLESVIGAYLLAKGDALFAWNPNPEDDRRSIRGEVDDDYEHMDGQRRRELKTRTSTTGLR